MGAYIRKTRNTWELWTNYGQGWEHEVTELRFSEIMARKREYRENVPGIRIKIRPRRETIEGRG